MSVGRGREERRAAGASWVNSGVHLCDPELLEVLPEETPCDLPRDVFPGLVKGGRLFGFPLSGYRCAVDSPGRFT